MSLRGKLPFRKLRIKVAFPEWQTLKQKQNTETMLLIIIRNQDLR